MSKLNTSGEFEYRCAYRWLPIGDAATGEVEGFLGHSFSGEANARQDAINQIGRKLVHVNHGRRYKKQEEDNYDPSRLITDVTKLTAAEKVIVEADWKTGVRY